MKKIYSFLFYKMYKFAKAQEESIGTNFGFVGYAAIFELLHFAIIMVFFKIIGFEVNIGSKGMFIFLFVIIGVSLNYFIFIKSKLIYRINDYYQEKNYSVWKGNLLFFGYIIFLFTIMFIQAGYYQKYKA